MDIDFLELAEASPNPYVLMDRDLRLVWMNLAYCTVTMRAREDIIDRKMFDAFPADPDSESSDPRCDTNADEAICLPPAPLRAGSISHRV